MAHLELEATAKGYVLQRVTEQETQLVERFDTDEQGTRKLLATLQQELPEEGAHAVALAEGFDQETALALRDTIDADADAGPALRAFAVGITRSGERFPNA